MRHAAKCFDTAWNGQNREIVESVYATKNKHTNTNKQTKRRANQCDVGRSVNSPALQRHRVATAARSVHCVEVCEVCRSGSGADTQQRGASRHGSGDTVRRIDA